MVELKEVECGGGGWMKRDTRRHTGCVDVLDPL